MYNCLLKVCACFKLPKNTTEFDLIRKIRSVSCTRIHFKKPKANPRGPEELKGDTGAARRFLLLLIQLLTSLKYGKKLSKEF